MEILVLVPIILSFLTVLIVIPLWIHKAKDINLVGPDVNKLSRRNVAESGGLIVVTGFILGVLLYVAIQTFYIDSGNHFIEVFALTTSILILAGIGIIDDLLSWQHGGIRKRHRLLLVLIAAIPLIVINAGSSQIYLPFLGPTNIGIIYPLLFIPIGIVGATTTFNFLAGYNGLEANQGILLLSALAIVSLLTGSSWLGIISTIMITALLGFVFYNKYPAKIFPGDSLTYPVGGLIAIMAILGNYELFAVFIFIPYIFETLLKLRGGLIKQSFGVPKKDGSITNKYDKVYGLEHLSIRIIERIKGKAYEWELVLLINLFQIAVILLGFWIFII